MFLYFTSSRNGYCSKWITGNISKYTWLKRRWTWLNSTNSTVKKSQNYAKFNLRKDLLGDDIYRSLFHQEFSNLQIGKFPVATAELSESQVLIKDSDTTRWEIFQPRLQASELLSSIVKRIYSLLICSLSPAPNTTVFCTPVIPWPDGPEQ